MEQKAKEMYVPLRITVYRVMLEQGLAEVAPVSVILTSDSVQQDGEWKEDESAAPSEGGIWMGF
jgi:hypothetical protein